MGDVLFKFVDSLSTELQKSDYELLHRKIKKKKQKGEYKF